MKPVFAGFGIALVIVVLAGLWLAFNPLRSERCDAGGRDPDCQISRAPG